MEYSPMPLLPSEPSLFPETFFSSDDCSQAVPDWLVIYTRARAEKALARQLLARRVGFFLPLHERRWLSPSGRTRCSYVPLFPGYVFLHGATETRWHALQTGMVSRCLSVADQIGLHQDLTRIYRLICSGAPLLPEERLEPGSLVEIVFGSLAGLQGKVIGRGKQLRLVVEVELLQRGVSVEIDSHMVEPIGKPPNPASLTRKSTKRVLGFQVATPLGGEESASPSDRLLLTPAGAEIPGGESDPLDLGVGVLHPPKTAPQQ
jgi:transcriptional antiterminator RfaH